MLFFSVVWFLKYVCLESYKYKSVKKLLLLYEKIKEWIFNEFNEYLRLLCGGVKFWILIVVSVL